MSIFTKHYLSNKYPTLFEKAKVNTILRLAHFLGQGMTESSLKPKQENLNYAANKVRGVFGAARISQEDANKYGRIDGKQKANIEMIANTVYGGAWGLKNLGNKVFGDGWKYRGRGIFQITGRANYEALTKYAREVLGMNVDYVKNPDLLLEEADSLIGALWYWNTRKLSDYADKNNSLAVSKGINLGDPNSKNTPNHAKERKEATDKFITEFNKAA